MNNEIFTVGAAAVAAVLAAGSLRAESPGGARFDPDRPFEVFASAPADAVRMKPDTISNDVTRLKCLVAPVGSVSANDFDRWNAIGVPILAALPKEGARTNAVSAWLQGYAGIVAAPSDDLALGLTDVRALARLNALSRKVKAMKAPDKMWLEGRRGLFQIDSINVARNDADLTRLNAYARIRRLAAFAKEPEGIAFDLKLPERPPLVPKKFVTKRRQGPTKSEIAKEFWNHAHFETYDRAIRPWTELARWAYEESLMGLPDPGVPTWCWRDHENEKQFVERRLEIVRRKFGPVADMVRSVGKSDAHRPTPPKALAETGDEQRRIYDMLPEMDLLVETVARMRVEYMLDRLNGREVKELPPPPKKKLVLKIDDPEDAPVDLDL